MRGKDIDVQIQRIKEWRTDGVLVDPQQREQLYIFECDAQTAYELAKKDPKQYVYQNGSIIEFESGRPADKEVVEAIELRVNQRLKNENRAGDESIRKLEGLTTLRGK